jgi:hypothetical protein
VSHTHELALLTPDTVSLIKQYWTWQWRIIIHVRMAHEYAKVTHMEMMYQSHSSQKLSSLAKPVFESSGGLKMEERERMLLDCEVFVSCSIQVLVLIFVSRNRHHTLSGRKMAISLIMIIVHSPATT